MKKLFLIAVLLIFNVACGKKDTRTSYKLNTNDHSYQYQDGAVSDGNSFNRTSICAWSHSTLPGTFWVNPNVSDKTFQKALDRFFTAIGKPEELIGYVSGQCSESTGIRFTAKAYTPNTLSRTRYPSERIDINQGSLEMVIFDDQSRDDPDTSGVLFEGNLKTGYILPDGFVRLEYTWGSLGAVYGTIVLEGTYDQNDFFGDVLIYNERHFDPSKSPENFMLSRFEIPVCEIFDCE